MKAEGKAKEEAAEKAKEEAERNPTEKAETPPTPNKSPKLFPDGLRASPTHTGGQYSGV